MLKQLTANVWKRLDRRLMILIFITVIPINVLAIGLSGMVIQESRERVSLSMVREFESLASRENGKLNSMEDWYREQIEVDLDRLVSPARFSAVYSICTANQMGILLKQQAVYGFAFVWEHAGEEKLYVKANTERLGLQEIQDLKQELLCTSAVKNGIQCYLGRYYYCQTYSFRNYSIGFGIDLEQELAAWDTALLEECIIKLETGETAVITDMGEGLKYAGEREEEGILAREQVGAMDLFLLRPSEQVHMPPSYLLLQGIAWGSVFLLAILWWLIWRQVIQPLRVLRSGMLAFEQDNNYRITSASSTEDFSDLYDTFNKMAEDIYKSHEKDILLYQTQLNNLKLQVNPHMLLNSLTMIYSMAGTQQYALIREFTMNLTKYFRYCLRENNTLVPLQAEMEFVDTYMKLQEMRYPKELETEYQVEEGLEMALIPPLLIQNFVENAVKYAREPEHTTLVRICVCQESGFLSIMVEDTGRGIEPDVLNRINSGEMYVDQNGNKHIGIWNCRRRLDTVFGLEAFIEVTSTRGKGTKVRIRLPLNIREEIP